MSRTSILVIIVLVALAVAAFFLVSSSMQKNTGTPTSSPISNQTPTETPNVTSSPSGEAVQTSQVTISNFSFNPSSVTVKKGTKVTWTNNDNVPHAVNSDNGIFNSQTMQPGDSFSFTFTEAGSYPYNCSIHPNMKATIVVTE